MFGFGRLVSLRYFEHIAAGLSERFEAAGRAARIEVCEVHPTASIRRRARTLAELIATAKTHDGPIHLLGHSTGGLDCRLLASPSIHLPRMPEGTLSFLPRLRSITTMNTPHYGTPLATFFATVNGQRLLYAVSALSVIALKMGSPPLAAASALLAALGRFDFGSLELRMLDRAAETIVRVLDESSRDELREWLKLLRDDQGAILQLTPEAMDLFQAGIENCPGVHYQSTMSFVPPHASVSLTRAMTSPWTAISAAIFSALQKVTSYHDERYPCSAPTEDLDRALVHALGSAVPISANDGVVPLSSQLWGKPVWIGHGDHLDVVGHFDGQAGHHDWLSSGSHFSRARFDTLLDAIAGGMLASEADA